MNVDISAVLQSSSPFSEIIAAANFPSARYLRGEALLEIAQRTSSAYMVRVGRAKVVMDAPEGRSAIVQIVGPGAFIGLGRAILNTPANHTVIAIEPVETALIDRSAILAAMTADPHVAVAVTELISAEQDAVERALSMLLVCRTAHERFVQLLQHWCATCGQTTANGTRIYAPFTHDEYAQMIGSTRETVTRLIGRLRREGTITVNGVNMYVNVAALAVAAGDLEARLTAA